jgi:antitoxin HicB
MTHLAYSVVVEPLSMEEGGGYVGRVPALAGCMSDGETPEEALRNVEDAIKCWLEEAHALGRLIPEPPKTLQMA